MERLQKKCLIASAGLHLLLAGILVIGPAFISSKPKGEDPPILDFVPVKTIDALMSGGGNPHGGSPPPVPAPQPEPQPEPPKPAPPPVREPDPEPPKPRVQEAKEASLEPAKKKAPEVSTKLVRRNDSAKKTDKNVAKTNEENKAFAEAQQKIARALSRGAEGVRGDVSGATSVEMKGPGGGGVPYANFLQAVKTAYANAWAVPDGVANDMATAVASVTIARKGNVTSARILRRSGDPVVDQSVQATLDRVRYAAPLPEDAKEDERTVTINFNVRAKQGLG